jgi:hypothetical protein
MIALMGTKSLMSWVKEFYDTLIPFSDKSQLKILGEKDSFEYKIIGAKAYWLGKLFLSLDIPRLNRKWDILRQYIKDIDEGKTSKRMLFQVNKLKPSQEILNEFNLQ